MNCPGLFLYEENHLHTWPVVMILPEFWMRYVVEFQLILKIDLFIEYKRVPHQEYIIQFLPVHIHRCDLVIVIGRIIVDPLVCVAAGCVDCGFIFPIPDFAATSGLIN